MEKVNASVVCFGEVLWDVLPDRRIPGGAPMNVAYHLHKLGVRSHIVSSIGKDKAGADLTGFLHSIGLSTAHVQINDHHATSEVLASIGDHNEVSYEIIYPVAWDKISWDENLAELVDQSEAFVFGSLGSRDPKSRNTLMKMLDYAKYCVFDVNLREPHYSVQTISDLLSRADLVKLNANELSLIAGWFDESRETESECVNLLFSQFQLKEVLITKGSTGATYYTPQYRYDYPAYKINVADTIGSGDAFLAAFLAMKLKNEPLEITLDHAVAMGAFITSQSGACPVYSKYDLGRFIWRKKLGVNNALQHARI
ncbi:fructokinase [Mucilaginibacter oryzae]|uniref:Fructokinase n=1 Tax=Mucilaginibacter oryzae TaxID=468058 RepID=A0A316HH58_9SPHI|nr:carbohydrate kinase [Mucilaginibacter oryzae]PWK79707.1 fructokinase [Mucilaginibacter oryzae]